MGQYWKCMLVEENGYVKQLDPNDSGLKLMEHSWIGNWNVGSVYRHIMRRACRVYWVGDYASDIIDAMPDSVKKKKLQNLWLKAWRDSAEVEEIEKYQESFNYDGFLINSTKQEYLDIKKYYEESKVLENGDSWCIDPLPLLTAIPGTNGQGGGDYFSKTGAEFVGYWSGDIISFERKAPVADEGYSEIEIKFKEG